MKILFLNTFYRNGGAARSTERIFNSIKKINELLKLDEGEFKAIIAPPGWESGWLQL